MNQNYNIFHSKQKAGCGMECDTTLFNMHFNYSQLTMNQSVRTHFNASQEFQLQVFRYLKSPMGQLQYPLIAIF